MGQLLAEAGFVVVTGGYQGVMEAVSRGAAEAGGEAEGVVCHAFCDRRPNAHLTRIVWTAHLFERMNVLIGTADAYVALEPRAGTLSEVAALWAFRKAGHLPPRPLVLVGPVWERLRSQLAETGVVEKDLLEWAMYVSDGREAALAVSDSLLSERPERVV